MVVTSFVETCRRMERGESAEHLLDDIDPYSYKNPLEVALLCEELLVLIDEPLCCHFVSSYNINL